MKIYLIRHAQKESEGENPNLTKKGIKQAAYLAKRISKIKFDKFYCSDMNRTRQTSEIISKKIKMKPVIEKSLNEYETSDLKKDISKWSVNDRKRIKEMYKFIDKITKNPKKEERILIVAHGITNRILMGYLMKFKLSELLPFMQDETCVNKFEYSPKKNNWRLIKWNDNTHIPRNLR